MATVVAFEQQAPQSAIEEWGRMTFWLAELEAENKVLWASSDVYPGNVCKVLDDIADDFQFVPALDGSFMLGAPEEPLGWFVSLNWTKACLRTDQNILYLGGRVDYDEGDPMESVFAIGLPTHDAFVKHMRVIEQKTLKLCHTRWNDQCGYQQMVAATLPLTCADSPESMRTWIESLR